MSADRVPLGSWTCPSGDAPVSRALDACAILETIAARQVVELEPQDD